MDGQGEVDVHTRNGMLSEWRRALSQGPPGKVRAVAKKQVTLVRVPLHITEVYGQENLVQSDIVRSAPLSNKRPLETQEESDEEHEEEEEVVMHDEEKEYLFEEPEESAGNQKRKKSQNSERAVVAQPVKRGGGLNSGKPPAVVVWDADKLQKEARIKKMARALDAKEKVDPKEHRKSEHKSEKKSVKTVPPTPAALPKDVKMVQVVVRPVYPAYPGMRTLRAGSEYIVFVPSDSFITTDQSICALPVEVREKFWGSLTEHSMRYVRILSVNGTMIAGGPTADVLANTGSNIIYILSEDTVMNCDYEAFLSRFSKEKQGVEKEKVTEEVASSLLAIISGTVKPEAVEVPYDLLNIRSNNKRLVAYDKLVSLVKSLEARQAESSVSFDVLLSVLERMLQQFGQKDIIVQGDGSSKLEGALESIQDQLMSMEELNGTRIDACVDKLDACVAHFATVFSKLGQMNQEPGGEGLIQELLRHQDHTVDMAVAAVKWEECCGCKRKIGRAFGRPRAILLPCFCVNYCQDCAVQYQQGEICANSYCRRVGKGQATPSIPDDA